MRREEKRRELALKVRGLEIALDVYGELIRKGEEGRIGAEEVGGVKWEKESSFKRGVVVKYILTEVEIGIDYVQESCQLNHIKFRGYDIEQKKPLSGGVFIGESVNLRVRGSLQRARQRVESRLFESLTLLNQVDKLYDEMERDEEQIVRLKRAVERIREIFIHSDVN